MCLSKKKRSGDKSAPRGSQSRSLLAMSSECYIEVDKKPRQSAKKSVKPAASSRTNNDAPPPKTPRPSARRLSGFEGGNPCPCSSASEGTCVGCRRDFCRSHLRLFDDVVYCYVCVGAVGRAALAPVTLGAGFAAALRQGDTPTKADESRNAERRRQAEFEARMLQGGRVNRR